MRSAERRSGPSRAPDQISQTALDAMQTVSAEVTDTTTARPSSTRFDLPKMISRKPCLPTNLSAPKDHCGSLNYYARSSSFFRLGAFCRDRSWLQALANLDSFSREIATCYRVTNNSPEGFGSSLLDVGEGSFDHCLRVLPSIGLVSLMGATHLKQLPLRWRAALNVDGIAGDLVVRFCAVKRLPLILT